MTILAALLFLAVSVLPAAALTLSEIDSAAARATSGLRTVTRRMASDLLQGRDNNTPESLRVQTYLLRRLGRIGVGIDPSQTRYDAYRQPFEQSGQIGTNLLAVVPGRELPDEYVVVGAHYDHLGTRSDANGACTAGGTPGGEVCNGATDNAAGVAAVLAIGSALRRLPTPPRRSIVLALWDVEEDGLLGSLYYVTNPVVPIAATVAYVNFDIQGGVLLPSLRSTSFAVGSETGGAALQDLVTSAVSADTLGVRELSYIFGQLRSDYKNFVEQGVPTVFFSDATGACYHTTGDDVRVVDFEKLRAQARIAFRVAVTPAENDPPPTYKNPSPGLAKYADAIVLRDVFTRAMPDLSLFPPDDQATLQDIANQLVTIVNDGPSNFDGSDV